MPDDVESLKAALAERDREIALLKSRLQEEFLNTECPANKLTVDHSELSAAEIKRYARQLVLPEISVEGQMKLKNSKVLIVGAGGLGCPVGLYLTAAGVGTIGIVDYDLLDESNFHRQISHTEKFIGKNKCDSFAHAMRNLNSCVDINKHTLLLNSKNAEEIIKIYDIIVDATDNVPTRYLLSDAAVMLKKPLVSGSALKFEGQLTIYNYMEGPCYRCLFPNPPSPDVVTNCSDGGVIGAVTGVIGSLQALEVIKIIVGLKPSYCKRMLVFDGITGDIHLFKLRGKKLDCKACGNKPAITSLLDYEIFCNAKANDKDSRVSLLTDSERISCHEYQNILQSGVPHVLVDVRSEHEVKICVLPNSFNMPINKIADKMLLSTLQNLLEKTNQLKHYVICRRGNDSQKAVKVLQNHLGKYLWYDIIGGLYSWHDEVDSTLPLY